MKLHKVDDENKSLKGIEFTLYKDADLKQKVKSGTTDADGNLTFDNLEITTWLKQKGMRHGI